MASLTKRFINSILARFGYEIKKKGKKGRSEKYDLEEEAEDLIRVIRPYTMVAHKALLILYQQVVYCERQNLKGCYIECGVWKGGAIGLMALANLKFGFQRRHIHLFDSFQEICEPDETVDGKRAIKEVYEWAKEPGKAGKLRPLKGIYDHRGGPGTLQENKALLENIIGYKKDYLHYHKGWFQETLPKVAESIDQIAMLRIDADWYASTKICLDYLYNKVVKGGFVIIDDYGAYEGCKKAVDEFMQANKVSAFLCHVNNDVRYLIKT